MALAEKEDVPLYFEAAVAGGIPIIKVVREALVGNHIQSIYGIINGLAEQGKAVIVISSEMPELLGISDRIYVMNEGAFVAEMPTREATQERIMRAIMKSWEN